MDSSGEETFDMKQTTHGVTSGSDSPGNTADHRETEGADIYTGTGSGEPERSSDVTRPADDFEFVQQILERHDREMRQNEENMQASGHKVSEPHGSGPQSDKSSSTLQQCPTILLTTPDNKESRYEEPRTDSEDLEDAQEDCAEEEMDKRRKDVYPVVQEVEFKDCEFDPSGSKGLADRVFDRTSGARTLVRTQENLVSQLNQLKRDMGLFSRELDDIRKLRGQTNIRRYVRESSPSRPFRDTGNMRAARSWANLAGSQFYGTRSHESSPDVDYQRIPTRRVIPSSTVGSRPTYLSGSSGASREYVPPTFLSRERNGLRHATSDMSIYNGKDDLDITRITPLTRDTQFRRPLADYNSIYSRVAGYDIDSRPTGRRSYDQPGLSSEPIIQYMKRNMGGVYDF